MSTDVSKVAKDAAHKQRLAIGLAMRQRIRELDPLGFTDDRSDLPRIRLPIEPADPLERAAELRRWLLVLTAVDMLEVL